jgi:hypothetical protein
MQVIKILISEKLTTAKFALNKASSGNILELCQAYLQLLNEFCDDLHKLNKEPAINLSQSSPLARELGEQTRKAILTEFELTNQERNHIDSLFKSFTNITGFDAVQTFNQLEYKGFADWELRATNEVRLKNDDNSQKMTVQEAIEMAGLLRRKAYVIYKTTFFTDQSK